jgi:hypothetical protein
MIIPSKHSGYQAGIRLYPMGGGGGGSSEPAQPAAPPPPPDRMASAAPPPMFQTYGQGDRTGSMVQSGSGFRPSQLDYSRPIYDPNYADNITGYQQSSQFYQPVYGSSYQNYARPSTQFNASLYGTQPMNSPAFNSGMSRGNINNSIENFYRTNPMGRNADISNTLNFMRDSGVNREDFQSWGGLNNYSPQASAYQQAPFNPYTNSSGYGGFMPQMQSPFSGGYQGQQQPQPLTSSMQGQQQPTQQMMSNFQNAQQSSQAAPQQPPPLQQSYSGQEAMNMGLGGGFNGGFMPQMQNPFARQLPQYVYDTNRNLDQYQARPVQQTNYGPSQPIYSRSTQGRGTPNVIRRAEGGIASLMDDVE